MERISQAEQLIIERLMVQVHARSKPKQVNFCADWLLEGTAGSSVWVTTNSGKEEYSDGLWHNTKDINFNRLLANGTKLDAPANEKPLIAIQTWAFLLREGSLAFDVSPTIWLRNVRAAINLTSWMSLKPKVFNIELYGLSQLTQDELKKLFSDLSLGGWPRALRFEQRIYDHLHTKAFGCAPGPMTLDELFNLPDEIKSKISRFLESEGFLANSITTKFDSQDLISRNYLADIVGATPTSFTGDSIRCFLRQFEPKLKHPHLLIEPQQFTRYPSQNTPLLSECLNSGISESYLLEQKSFFTRIIEISNHEISDWVPIDLSSPDAYNSAKESCKDSLLTKFIPLHRGFQSLDSAIMWIELYGDAIVDCTIYFVKFIRNLGAVTDWERNKIINDEFIRTANTWKTNEFDGYPAAPIKDALNIGCFSDGKQRKDFGEEPPFTMIMLALIGACAISVSLLKPSRDAEIATLSRNCLTSDEKGFWLNFYLGKSGQKGLNKTTQKPIPWITAKAIYLLQRLGNSLKELYKDNSKHSGDLFYFPAGKGMSKPGNTNLNGRINNCIDIFVDFLPSELDQFGRNWYPRIHEMRKFFLLLLYWHGKHQNLDAVRWIAGHTNERHARGYVSFDVDGEEMALLEAECLDDRLIQLERNKLNPEKHTGLVALHQKVCDRFKVKSIRGINTSKNYFSLLQHYLVNEICEIRPILISASNSSNEKIDLEIAVKCDGVEDEKFNNK